MVWPKHAFPISNICSSSRNARPLISLFSSLVPVVHFSVLSQLTSSVQCCCNTEDNTAWHTLFPFHTSISTHLSLSPFSAFLVSSAVTFPSQATFSCLSPWGGGCFLTVSCHVLIIPARGVKERKKQRQCECVRKMERARWWWLVKRPLSASSY